MVAAVLDIRRRYVPPALLDVELVPGGFPEFAAADTGEGREDESVDSDGVGVGRCHDPEGFSEMLVMDVSAVFGFYVNGDHTVQGYLGGIGVAVTQGYGVFHYLADPASEVHGRSCVW